MVLLKDRTLVQGIVIAREQNNGPAPAGPRRESLGEALPPIFRWFWRVENVTGPDNRIDVVLLRQRQNLLDDRQSRTRELTAIVGLELAEFAAQMQVGGVEQLQH